MLSSWAFLARPFRPPGDGSSASHPGRCPGLRESGPFGPQADLAPETGASAGAAKSRSDRLLSGPKAWAPSAQPNGLGCDRSPASSKPHRGAIANLAAKPGAAGYATWLR